MLMYHELQLAADFMNKRTEATLNKCGLSDITMIPNIKAHLCLEKRHVC